MLIQTQYTPDRHTLVDTDTVHTVTGTTYTVTGTHVVDTTTAHNVTGTHIHRDRHTRC